MSTFIYRGRYYGGGFFSGSKEPEYTIRNESDGTFIYRGRYYGGGGEKHYGFIMNTLMYYN